jgi:hypothetical protein
MMNIKKTSLYALAALLLIAVFYGVYLGWVKKDMSDFGVCYRAGQRILWGETLYRTVDGHLQYKYAPVSALFYSAFAALPYEVAKVIWYYLELFCLFAGFWSSYRCLPSWPYFLLKRRLKIVASGVAFLAIGLIVPALIFGWEGNLVVLREWVGTLSQSTPVLMAVSDNASLYAFLWKLLGGQDKVWVEILFGAVFAALGAAFLWMMEQGKKSSLARPETLEVSFLFTLIPLFSPLGWYYNYLYALPAVVLLLNYIGLFPPALKYILAGNFIIIGASLREILGKTLFRFYNRKSLMVINALIILGGLAYLRLKKRA